MLPCFSCRLMQLIPQCCRHSQPARLIAYYLFRMCRAHSTPVLMVTCSSTEHQGILAVPCPTQVLQVMDHPRRRVIIFKGGGYVYADMEAMIDQAGASAWGRRCCKLCTCVAFSAQWTWGL